MKARSKFPIVNDLDRMLTAMNASVALEVGALKRATALTIAHHKRAVSTAKREAQGLRRQRDAALGKVAEYRGYAQRYQRELVAARKEIAKLLKEADA